jgi:DNA-directed RNA polymerase sigma subunit (sigma70/sigma32)
MGLGADRPEPGAPREANRSGSAGGDDDDFGGLDAPDTLAVLIEGVDQVPSLKAGEQDVLLKKLKQGDARARERLLETHLYVVLASATARQDRGLPVGDLFQEGSLGLFAAIGDFAGSSREEFEKFIVEQVDTCLEAALKEEEEAVKAERALILAAEDFDRVEMMLAKELRRKPTDLEIGTRLEWDAARTAQVREIVDESRRQHDAEILALLEPDEMDLLEPLDLPELEGDEGHRANRDGSLN